MVLHAQVRPALQRGLTAMDLVIQTLSDFFGDILRPLRVLVVAALGLVVALFLFEQRYVVVIILLIAAILLAFLLDAIGRQFLPNSPRAGLFCLEGWVIAPATVTVVISGTAIVVGVWLTPLDHAPEATKALLNAGGAAIAAFFGALVSWVGESDGTRISGRIERIFYSFYDRPKAMPRDPRKHYFIPESRGELAVYSSSIEGVEGWGISARWQRARILAEELKSGTSDAP